MYRYQFTHRYKYIEYFAYNNIIIVVYISMESKYSDSKESEGARDSKRIGIDRNDDCKSSYNSNSSSNGSSRAEAITADFVAFTTSSNFVQVVTDFYSRHCHEFEGYAELVAR